MLVVTVYFHSCVSIIRVSRQLQVRICLDVLLLKLQLHAIFELLCAFTLGNKK